MFHHSTQAKCMKSTSRFGRRTALKKQRCQKINRYFLTFNILNKTPFCMLFDFPRNMFQDFQKILHYIFASDQAPQNHKNRSNMHRKPYHCAAHWKHPGYPGGERQQGGPCFHPMSQFRPKYSWILLVFGKGILCSNLLP